MYISSSPWRNVVANSLTEMYSSPCLLLTYRSPYDENCRRKQFTWCCTYRRVNDDYWWQTYPRKCTDRLVSLMKIGGESDRFIYLRRRLPANLFTAAVHWCLWWKLVRSAPTDSRNGNWCSKRLFPEMNKSPFRNWEKKNPSLSPLRFATRCQRCHRFVARLLHRKEKFKEKPLGPE